jgi:hypothetical protein
MVNLNELKKLGWLTRRQIIQKHGAHNSDLMKKIIRSKGSEYPDDRKVILRKKDGEDEYLYSPELIKKITNSFILNDYYASEANREKLLRQDCHTSKELASKFRTTQSCLMSYIKKEGLDKVGLVKELKQGYLIHRSLYQKLESHFLSNRRYS